jgi:hypothetical protein
MYHISRFIKTALMAIAVFISVNNAHAVPIQFIYTGIGSGFIGTNYFQNTPFTINQYSDTENIISFRCLEFTCLSLEANSTSVSLEGFDTYSFLTATTTFFIEGFVGLSSAGIGARDLYTAFYTGKDYDLTSSIGPIPLASGAAGLIQWGPIGVPAIYTEAGMLNFLPIPTPGTFQAIAGVPLPATAWLFGSGLIALAGGMRRRLI